MSAARKGRPQRIKTAVPQCRSASWVAARLGGVSRVWIFKLHQHGLLRGYVVGRKPGDDRGGRLMFRESDVVRFLRAAGMPVEGVVDQS